MSIPLDEWFDMLSAGGQISEHPKQKEKMEEQSDFSLNFIQVCQNYVDDYGSDWCYLCHEPYLKHLYEAGTAFLHLSKLSSNWYGGTNLF